jgi:hypothetical protein
MRRIILLVTVAVVMAAMLVLGPGSATAVPGDDFPPGQGPSPNALKGLSKAEIKSSQSKSTTNDIVIVKLIDKASPSPS